MHKYDNQLEDFFGITTSGGGPNRETIKDALTRKLPLKSRLRLLPKVLGFRERYIVLSLALLIVGSLASIPFTTYYHYTRAIPANGGTVVEGEADEG
jgi:hypothetical protein